ncbi:hypothetical protein [Chondromyces crocatus]|nr:hypothetical protein [Chondromyces crocatus]
MKVQGSSRGDRLRRCAGRVLAVGLLACLVAACAQKEGWIDRRKRAYASVAAIVNGPFEKLRPFHERIAPESDADAVWVDARWDACREAAVEVGALAGVTMPPDEQGKTFEEAEAVSRAAVRYRDAIDACQRGDAGMPAAKPGPACVLRCMNSWSVLTKVAERLRVAAGWVDVKVEALGPPGPELLLR